MPRKRTAAPMETQPSPERQDTPTPMRAAPSKKTTLARPPPTAISVGKADAVRRSSLKKQRNQMEKITKGKGQ
jgi:hypothetical protein